jgi:uncharacterized membrane protein
MSSIPQLRPWRRFVLVRIARGHPRLLVSIAVGLGVIAALPGEWRIATRLLVGWDVGLGLYLIAAYELIWRSDIARMRRHAALYDEGAVAILILTVGAALASLGAILAELGMPHAASGRSLAQLVLATVTIGISWAFIHTIFALHYAHEFYGERPGAAGGLSFPGGEAPDYWDFVYFSFVVGMTSQVSDVAVNSRRIRRTVTAHGAVSFLFNAALLALTVNIAASAI